MGLDMYLHRKAYVKNWDFMSPEELHQIEVKLNNEPHPFIQPKKICYITEEVGYWRKANAIHQWFVENCQDGVDDCKEYDVSHEQLEELLNLCKLALEHRPKDGDEEIDDITPESLLPTQSGFFFGSTDYDDYYFEDIENTINILEPLVADNKRIEKHNEELHAENNKIREANKEKNNNDTNALMRKDWWDTPEYSYRASW